ncbi:MAG: class IV adenylate cyclase [Euryarchaeota archaeon]|nr:class IV adenylate cyclase [Euryarchaeota archaeon]
MEVEIKARIPENFEERLRELNAEFLREVVEEDIYFNHPCRDFASTDEALRIRNDYTLTYKGPKVDKDTKSREEINLKIENIEDAAALLEKLGFRKVATVRKTRRYYSLDSLTICVDNVEKLGRFVEVECIGEYEPCREKVMELAHRLGLKNFERRSYLELVLQTGTA